MSLKQIPNEGIFGIDHAHGGKTCKHFNPGNKIKKQEKVENGAFSLKTICMELVHYINRGSKYTSQQVDELIHRMQRGVVGLQKTKHEMLEKKQQNVRKKGKK